MKLELKHLAPYLPYGLQIQMHSGTWTLERHLMQMLATESGHTNKLILHPISDLTKEIEHKGEKFNPFDELCKFSDYTEWLMSIEDDLYEMSTPQRWAYELVEKLFEWHFDVFGLIDEGLAIDTNK